MSNINFLNKPGIQENEKFHVDNITINEIPEKTLNELQPSLDKSNSYFSQALITAFLIFFSIFLYKFYYSNDFNNKKLKKNISISHVLKMFDSNKESSRLLNINFSKKHINIIMQYSNDKYIYDKLNLLNSLDVNAKAMVKNNNYLLYIHEPWSFNENNDWTLIRLQKFIEDFKGIKSEIFNDKLIVVSNQKDLISLFESFDKQEISNLFIFSVDIIEKTSTTNSNYYKFIIELDD